MRAMENLLDKGIVQYLRIPKTSFDSAVRARPSLSCQS